MKTLYLIPIFGCGVALAGFGLSGLKSREGGLQYHRNPFAIKESGYGKTLARLSQNTIDVVWHLGIEQVNPLDHDHHDHEEGAEGHDDHAGHDHDDHAGHDHDDHAGHDHNDHAGHDHDEVVVKGSPAQHGWLEETKEWMHDLGIARYNRNSPFAVSGVHQKAIAADIEKMLLRSYQMDPTDFGVYNGYFMFLTIHQYGGTPATREHARLISRMTIGQAMKEEVDPQPWITAAMATMNLFFLEQEDYKTRGETIPVKLLEEFRQQMAYVLHRHAVLREEAKVAGRWDMISEERKESMRERERFATMASEQFDVMLAKARSNEKGSAPAGAGVAADAEVAGKTGEEADQPENR